MEMNAISAVAIFLDSMQKKHISYPNLQSAIRPDLHEPDVPVSTPPAVLKDLEESSAKMSSDCK